MVDIEEIKDLRFRRRYEEANKLLILFHKEKKESQEKLKKEMTKELNQQRRQQKKELGLCRFNTKCNQKAHKHYACCKEHLDYKRRKNKEYRTKQTKKKYVLSK
jgi:hypothetical protein